MFAEVVNKMACDVDELDINPFFKALQTRFSDLYERAQEKCHTICIPQSTSIENSAISKDFAETHILKPSPYFKGELLTSHNSNCKSVTLRDDGCTITTGEGFKERLTVKIISEELAYNKDYKQYRILILDQPFDPKFHTTKDVTNGQRQPAQFVTLAECKDFLRSSPEFSKVVEKVDQAVKLFNTNYMVLPDYLTEAVSRLEDIASEAVEGCVRCAKKKKKDVQWRDSLDVAIESYVMSGVHKKILSVVSQHFAADDRCVWHKCQDQLDGVSPEALGVPQRFSCPLPEAVKEFNRLSHLTTPREKLHCLKSVIDAVMAGISAHLTRDVPPHLALTADMPCLTSDDLIPILVNVISQSQCQQLQSDIIYMEFFTWASSAKDKDDLSYCLVTFKAAVQYILSTDFSHLPQKNTFKKQTSIDRLSPGFDRLSLSNGNSRGDKSVSPCHSPTPFTSSSPTTVAGGDRLERQRSRISKVLEEQGPSMEDKQQKVKSIFGAHYEVPVALETAEKPQPPSQLGDFLSALQDDFMDQPFGKQA